MSTPEKLSQVPKVRHPKKSVWQGHYTGTEAPWNLHCGDASKVLATLDKDRYQCVITSPPYFWQRDYGVKGQIGIEESVDGYVDAIGSVMDGVKRVLHPRGVLFLNLGDTYYSGKGMPHGNDKKHSGRRFKSLRAVDKTGLGPPKKTLLGMPWRVALAMIDRDWILRSSIIWRRPKPLPESNARDRPWRTYEFIFLFVKSRTYHFDRGPLKLLGDEDIWTIESRSSPGRTHPAVFPAALVNRCLDLGNTENGIVLDPFAGSGTVLKEAWERGMPADGIELSRTYCDSIRRRLQS